MRIGLDIDGVLYPWQSLAYEEAVRYYGVTESFENFWKNFDANYTKTFMYNILHDIHLYSVALALPEDIRVVQDLSKTNSIYYISCRPDLAYITTKRWLDRNGFPNSENLIFTDDKLKSIIEYEIDTYLEDQPNYAYKLKDYTEVILFEQPWNLEARDDFLTVKSVAQFGELVNVI